MEVLQAVHLLLAFPLFAVVVAVDPRWLLYSVRQHSAAFRDDEDETNDGLTDEERAHWRSTPMNYLEKVFQIPFTLRPMGSVGFGKMVEALAAPIAASATTNGSGNAGTPSSAAADRPTQPDDGTTGAATAGRPMDTGHPRTRRPRARPGRRQRHDPASPGSSRETATRLPASRTSRPERTVVTPRRPRPPSAPAT